MIIRVVSPGYVLSGLMSTGSFVGILLLVGVFFRPLDKITAVVEPYMRGSAGFLRYLEQLATESEITGSPDARTVSTLRNEIRPNDLTFAFTPGRPRAARYLPACAAIVGESGFGELTLLSLQPRFYVPKPGTIRNTDWMVVMQQGRMVEVGTHAELLEREGPYAKLAA